MIEQGSSLPPRSAADLLPLLYAELKAMAERHMQHESPGQTLQATALVHEAYLRIVGDSDASFDGRAHFFAAAAAAMRRILIERARAKGRLKRGGPLARAEWSEVATLGGPEELDVLDLDEALARLAQEDLRAARVVELRFFAGLELTEVAQLMGVSLATVKTDWNYARAWLHRALSR